MNTTKTRRQMVRALMAAGLSAGELRGVSLWAIRQLYSAMPK